MVERYMTSEEVEAEIKRWEHEPSLAQLRAAKAFNDFVTSNPSFYDCSENVSAVVAWMEKHTCPASVENYEIAAAALDSAQLLLARGDSADKPVEREMTLAEIDAMPSGEYRRRLNDPAFVDLVNRLEAAKRAKPLPIRR